MIVYLANKIQFRAGILSNRIEFNIPRTGEKVWLAAVVSNN